MSLIKILVISFLFCLNFAHATDLKSKPITVIIPFAPGGGVDQAFRHLQKYAVEQGMVMNGVYKSGADGFIGSEELLKSPADGNTIAVTTAGVLANYYLKNDHRFVIVTGIKDSIGTFLTYEGSPYKTIEDVERALRNGENLKFGYGAPGQLMQLSQWIEFIKPTKEPVMVPYKGGGPVVNDLTGKHIDIAQLPLAIAKQLIDNGKFRLLAVTGGKVEEYNVPLMEQKYKNWEKTDGFVVALPPGSDSAIVKVWSEFMRKYLNDAATKQDFAREYSILVPFGPNHTEKTIEAAKTKLKKINEATK
jgi:tripartite-type tricarboxylate transporter receptor subunit TctC